MSESVSAVVSIDQMLPGAFFEKHRSEVASAMLRVMDSGWYVLGEEVKRFEEEFAAHFGYGAAVGVANGTDAIALALRALGVGPGDRVATVSHTAVATVAAIGMAGASPVLVDIEPRSYTMDPVSLRRTLTATQVKAVIVVHLYGSPADMPALAKVTNEYGALLIEDCSQAHGALLGGRPVGCFGDIATFSFYPTKNLGAMGDGGMVVSADSELIRRVKILREYGWEQRYVSEIAGVNSRLDELQAAILRVRLPYLDAGNKRRSELAAIYDRGLADSSLALPKVGVGATHVYHQYVVRHPGRDQLQQQLKDRGVRTNIHYPVPVHRQPAYASGCFLDPLGLPVTEVVASEILSLPMYPELSDAAAAAVVEQVRDSLHMN